MTRATNAKTRSRLEILHYVLSFCTSRRYTDGERIFAGIEGFFVADSWGFNRETMVGDLVILSSAPASRWTIGWLVEIDRRADEYSTRYLVESLEDGAPLCWWENIGISYFPRDKLQPQWRWTDRQHAFKDRWLRVCNRGRSSYIVRPLYPVFGEGFAVTLGIRTSHGFDDIRPERSFPDWRKVTRKVMEQCYLDCVAERERTTEERKAKEEQDGKS